MAEAGDSERRDPSPPPPPLKKTREVNHHDHGAFRSDDPDTAVDAGLRTKTQPLEDKVLRVLRSVYPDTLAAIEVARILEKEEGRDGEYIWSISPRMRPLIDKGLIEEVGKRSVLNSNGKPRLMIILRAVMPQGWTKPAT